MDIRNVDLNLLKTAPIAGKSSLKPAKQPHMKRMTCLEKKPRLKIF